MAFLAALTVSALLPGFTPAASGPAGGQILIGIFPGAARAGYVYLPPGFDATHRYPVVYLLHGMPGSPDEYLGGTDLAPWADLQIRARAVRPFIAVIPPAGFDRDYNGEWGGPWETELVEGVVPWVDATLPTIPSPAGRVLAGLSAGGFGAADIGLRHPRVFGTIEAWGAYFFPPRDGPFAHATRKALDANDPRLLAPREARVLRRAHTRFFVSSGPSHSHWFGPADSVAFTRELRHLHVPVRLELIGSSRGQWRNQLTAGLGWAFARSSHAGPWPRSTAAIRYAPAPRLSR